MSRFDRAKHLDRRTFLKGSGIALALPWLDAMVPAFASTGENIYTAQSIRTVYVFVPNGMVMDSWHRSGKGTAQKLTATLEPLKSLSKEINVYSGLALDGGRAHGDGPGDHARCVASFLTSAHPKKTGGADIHVGVSIDQTIARAIGQATTFPSLELGMEAGRRSGACDSGYSCAYSNNISWRSPNTPVPKEVNPRQVFERLFGDPKQAMSDIEKGRRRAKQQSVLDVVMEDTRSLTRRLGHDDREKVDGYLTAVRDIERRMQRMTDSNPVVDLPEGLKNGTPGGYPDRLDLMYDIIALAMRADLSRTVTFMLGNAGSGRSHRFLKIPESHHRLSHHGGKEEKLVKLRKINRFHVEHFARFLKGLNDSADAGQPLLQNSLVMFGSGLSDSNRHRHEDLPILTAGRMGGKLRTGRHLVYPRDTPLANLHVETLSRLGIKQSSFADSTGGLKNL